LDNATCLNEIASAPEVALELQRRGGDLDVRTKEEVTLLHLAAYMAVPPSSPFEKTRQLLETSNKCS
jgi:hypothetical protein